MVFTRALWFGGQLSTTNWERSASHLFLVTPASTHSSTTAPNGKIGFTTDNTSDTPLLSVVIGNRNVATVLTPLYMNDALLLGGEKAVLEMLKGTTDAIQDNGMGDLPLVRGMKLSEAVATGPPVSLRITTLSLSLKNSEWGVVTHW